MSTTSNQPDQNESRDIPVIQRVIAIFWPSFLTAGVATGLFFTVFDPLDLAALTDYPDISRTGAYSIGFFLFWLLTSTTCALTCYFERPCGPRRKR
jgi:cytosine/uracil/thiamine/allantoin permease